MVQNMPDFLHASTRLAQGKSVDILGPISVPFRAAQVLRGPGIWSRWSLVNGVSDNQIYVSTMTFQPSWQMGPP